MSGCIKEVGRGQLKRYAPGEDQTHGLQIMRLPTALRRHVVSSVGESKRRKKFNKIRKIASAGNRTRIYCLEGNNANLYTTDARTLLALFKTRHSFQIMCSCAREVNRFFLRWTTSSLCFQLLTTV